MKSIPELLEDAKKHLDDNERVEATVFGAYATEAFGGDSVRNGLLIATDYRIVFYAKKFFGYQLKSFPFTKISSIETSESFMGTAITFFSAGTKVRIKWIDEIQDTDLPKFLSFTRSNIGKSSKGTSDDISVQIRKLADLHSARILADEEFGGKKVTC